MSKAKVAKKSTAKETKIAKTAPAKKPAKQRKGGAAPGEAKVKRVSAIDAAAKLLVGSKEAMGCKEMIEAMAAKGLWASPGGKTPSATLYSSIIREIATKGKDARFKKSDRGRFVANG